MDPQDPDPAGEADRVVGDFDGMFRFEKRMGTSENRGVKQMNNVEKRLKWLAVFVFFLAPVFAWGSVVASDETAVFASLSRMIWYSGSAARIFTAMLVLFVPMLVSFFLAHSLIGLPKPRKLLCRVCMVVSCIVLYIGAMWVMPSDGNSMTAENVWTGS